MSEPTSPRRLHLGCGRTIPPGWINLDFTQLPSVDVVAELIRQAASPDGFNRTGQIRDRSLFFPPLGPLPWAHWIPCSEVST